MKTSIFLKNNEHIKHLLSWIDEQTEYDLEKFFEKTDLFYSTENIYASTVINLFMDKGWIPVHNDISNIEKLYQLTLVKTFLIEIENLKLRETNSQQSR